MTTYYTYDPFQYAGQYTDSESGLQYLRARYYDPETAQFLAVDPLNPLVQQPYGYADDRPTTLVDPSGLIACGSPTGAVQAASALAGFGGTLVYAATCQNKSTKIGGQARLGRPNSSSKFGWDRSFHIDRPDKYNDYHFNADFGPFSRWNHADVPDWVYPLGSTSALKAVGRSTFVLGVGIDAYTIATAGPCHLGSAIGGVGGGWGGAFAGAAIGSAFAPGVGTIIGGVVGGVIGSAAGQYAGSYYAPWENG